MYRVLCDGSPIYDLRSEELVLLSPKVTLQDSNAGSFDFTVTPQHPKYDDIHKMSSNIQVFQDDEEIFAGRITEEKGDFYKRKNCHCEGELAYLNDTTQEPHEYHDQTVRGFLNTLLTIHNNKVASDKRFQVGIVTVTDPNDSLYRYTNFETTLTCINDKLVKSLGGHLRIRKEGGVRYLDYLADSPRTNTQVIKFGENLLDFSKNFDMNDLATVIIPLGARLDESPIEALEAYTTIESVNGGKLYLKSDSAVSKYGWIEQVVKWDNVSVPQILKDKCQAYLNDIQFENMVLEIKAIDLHNMDINVETIHVLDEIRAVSEPHGMDRYFPVTKLTIPLEHPNQATFTLGTEVRQSLTSASNNTNSDILKRIEAIPQKSEIMKEAIESATQLIHNALNGHVVTTPDEQLIMDTDDKATARKLWRWNLNGFGYSNTGYNGTYETAITMDGGILGKFIVANSISSDKIDVNYRTEVQNKIDLAEENANDATDTKLTSYYTKSQIETTIKNTKDSILLSASETATAYTDGKLKNYSTSAQVKVTTDAINTEVKKRVNYTDVISAINQSAETIAIKASKIKLEGLVTANKNFSIDIYGNMTAKNGTFTGTVTGSTITGSTMNIKSADGCTLNINASGLSLDASKTSNIFGYQGGKLIIGTTKSILDSMFSPICFYPASGGVWSMPLAQNVSKFRFVWQVMSSSYLEITTLWGAYGLTAWSSDRKMKKNIDDSELNGIDTLKKFVHRQFDWKSNDYHVDCGFVAQELAEINEDFVTIIQDKDMNGHLTGECTYQVNEGTVIPVISKALQELIVKVENLEERLKKYE